MKHSTKQQLELQIQEKKEKIPVESKRELAETLQPEVLSAFINIPFKKNKKDLLVVENDEMSLIVIKAILEKNHFTFEIATTEENAISEIENNHFHMILIGINDPEFLWERLLKKVWNENKGISKTFLLALTSHITEISISEFLKNNFDRVLTKPYRETELISIIRKYKKLKAAKNAPNDNHFTFSLEQLKKISNNNEEFIIKMLHKFIISALECGEEMTLGFNENNMVRLKKASHKGIPSYSIMGLNNLVECLVYMEANALSPQEKNNIQKRLADFDKKNKTVIKEIENYIHLKNKN